MRDLSTAADDLGFDVNIASGLDRYDDIAVIADCAGCIGYSECRSVVDEYPSSCPFRRRICDYLKKSRYKPVLVDDMITFRGNDIETEGMRHPISKYWYERGEIQEIARKVQGTI